MSVDRIKEQVMVTRKDTVAEIGAFDAIIRFREIGAETSVDRWQGCVLSLGGFLELKIESDDVKRC